jgi:hypothetical protein
MRKPPFSVLFRFVWVIRIPVAKSRTPLGGRRRFLHQHRSTQNEREPIWTTRVRSDTGCPNPIAQSWTLAVRSDTGCPNPIAQSWTLSVRSDASCPNPIPHSWTLSVRSDTGCPNLLAQSWTLAVRSDTGCPNPIPHSWTLAVRSDTGCPKLPERIHPVYLHLSTSVIRRQYMNCPEGASESAQSANQPTQNGREPPFLFRVRSRKKQSQLAFAHFPGG